MEEIYKQIDKLYRKDCRELGFPFIITFEKPFFEEYNTDTSAQLHRNMDEDIVRHSSEVETGEAEDKEPQI